MTHDCQKCKALREVIRQVAFADPDDLPKRVRDAYREYRRAVPEKGCVHAIQ